MPNPFNFAITGYLYKIDGIQDTIFTSLKAVTCFFENRTFLRFTSLSKTRKLV